MLQAISTPNTSGMRFRSQLGAMLPPKTLENRVVEDPGAVLDAPRGTLEAFLNRFGSLRAFLEAKQPAQGAFWALFRPPWARPGGLVPILRAVPPQCSGPQNSCYIVIYIYIISPGTPPQGPSGAQKPPRDPGAPPQGPHSQGGPLGPRDSKSWALIRIYI